MNSLPMTEIPLDIGVIKAFIALVPIEDDHLQKPAVFITEVYRFWLQI